MDFQPHPLLRSPHLQTLLSSRAVRRRDGTGAGLLTQAQIVMVECRDGVRLNPATRPGAPMVVLVHGLARGCRLALPAPGLGGASPGGLRRGEAVAPGPRRHRASEPRDVQCRAHRGGGGSVSRHTEFRDAREYYSHYTLTRERLRSLRFPARILVAEDDPVVPAEHFRVLQADGGDLVTLTRHGGHCGFIRDFSLSSALDAHMVEFFASAF